MKFGGTSVGDATCIRAVVDIVQTARHDANLVVVVSAMAGVTNRLIEAAVEAELGHSQTFETIFEGLRALHKSSIESLIESVEERGLLLQHMRYCFEEGERLCRGTLLVGELTARVRDAISSLGERLSAPLLAAALAQAGIPSEAIDATQLVVTDSRHGGAEPRMDLTRECCDSRVGPLLRRGILPVITGFIGATREGVLTTLGRGGSDYSATVLGAALDADEVIIWSDVDGLMTADPRLVPGACTIAEISYREAAELAYFGAKVLHPKTLRAVMKRGIPLWIRNTFAPEKAGTKITPDGPSVGGGVKSLTATREVALITVCSHGKTEIPNVLGRTLATTATVRAEVFLISQASSQSDICLVVAAPAAPLTLQALREEFAPDLGYDDVEHITLDPTVAMLTVVGLNMRGKSRIVERTFAALGRGNVDVIAIAQGSSECNLSVVVPKDDMQMALVTTHQEFNLGID
jgi:aspartate kinase